MKVLLINPNSSLIQKSWGYRKFCTPIAPLGLGYIANVLEQNQIEVSIFDQFANKQPDRDLFNFVKRVKPKIIGFAALTPIIPDLRRLVGGIRKIDEKCKIVLGNLHGTCFPDEVLKEGLADVVVRGEGELTMLELCRRLSAGESLAELAGMSFKLDGQIVHNPQRELIEDLDSLPFPAWHLLDLNNYTQHPLVAVNNSMAFPILASRGCPYRCYYCSQDKVYSKVRYRDLNRVVDEIEYFNDRFKVKFFGFCDAYFPFDENSGLQFCNIIIKRKLHKKIKWLTETRVDKVTPRLLNAMKEAGIHLIMYGIEVGNAQILKSLNKGTTLDQARVALRQTRKAGILSQGLFMLGLPGETKDICMDTINFAKELDCDLVKFNIATPYPGSRFFEDYQKTNTLKKPEQLTSWIDWTSFYEDLAYTPDGMDSNTLRQLQRKAMLEFYVRPKVIFRHIFRRTVSYRNVLCGGLWLITLYLLGLGKRIKQTFKAKKMNIFKVR